ncbi:MAG TPA: hypothetical protein VF230_15760 [Acidimicrobiales bacterium]
MTATYDNVARRQLGLVTHRQLAELNWTKQQIVVAQRRRELVRMRRGVYRCAGVPVTQAVVWLAAALAAGADHVLAHLTGAAIWAFKGYPAPESIHLLTASNSQARHDGVVTHRTIALPPSHVTTRDRLPVTTVARTLVDTCGDVPFDVLKRAANDAVRRTLVRPIDIVRCVEQVPVSGRRASRQARLLVAEFVPGYDAGGSDRELDIVELLVANGYPRPEQEIRVPTGGHTYRVDVGYPAIKHGFEFMSEKWHLNREAFHADPLRVMRLQRAGWTIWPITSRTAQAEILLTVATVAEFGQLRAA